MMKSTARKATKGMPPKMMKETKSMPSKGDKMSNNVSKTRDIKSLVAQKKGNEGTAVKNEKKAAMKDRKKRLEGVKF